MFRITGKLDPAQFQPGFFAPSDAARGRTQGADLHFFDPHALSFPAFPLPFRPFHAAPAPCSPGPLRLPKPRRRRLAPPFPPLGSLGATKKPAG